MFPLVLLRVRVIVRMGKSEAGLLYAKFVRWQVISDGEGERVEHCGALRSDVEYYK